MNSTNRIDMRLSLDDHSVIVEAARLASLSVSAFCRNAALQQAQALFAEEKNVALMRQDFDALTAAIARGFAPNAAMQKTLAASAEIKYA